MKTMDQISGFKNAYMRAGTKNVTMSSVVPLAVYLEMTDMEVEHVLATHCA